MQEISIPTGFAIIPASVRYDKDVPANAKLLFAEIMALTNKFGYCYAKNEYFAELYGLSEDRISKLIHILKKKGFLKIELERNEANFVINRKIFVCLDNSFSKSEVKNTDSDGKNNYEKKLKITSPDGKNNGSNNITSNNITLNINTSVPSEPFPEDPEKEVKKTKKVSKTKVNKTDEELESLFSNFETRDVNVAKTCINNFYLEKRRNDSKYARSPNQLRNWSYQLLNFAITSERGINEVAKVWNYVITDVYIMPYLESVKKFVENYEKYIQKCNTNSQRKGYQKQTLVGSGFDSTHTENYDYKQDEGKF